jgi:hypothetical protein
MGSVPPQRATVGQHAATHKPDDVANAIALGTDRGSQPTPVLALSTYCALGSEPSTHWRSLL